MDYQGHRLIVRRTKLSGPQPSLFPTFRYYAFVTNRSGDDECGQHLRARRSRQPLPAEAHGERRGPPGTPQPAAPCRPAVGGHRFPWCPPRSSPILRWPRSAPPSSSYAMPGALTWSRPGTTGTPRTAGARGHHRVREGSRRPGDPPPPRRPHRRPPGIGADSTAHPSDVPRQHRRRGVLLALSPPACTCASTASQGSSLLAWLHHPFQGMEPPRNPEWFNQGRTPPPRLQTRWQGRTAPERELISGAHNLFELCRRALRDTAAAPCSRIAPGRELIEQLPSDQPPDRTAPASMRSVIGGPRSPPLPCLARFESVVRHARKRSIFHGCFLSLDW